MYKKLLNALMFSFLALALSFGVSYVSAWTAPTQSPPNGNTPPPINTSATTQNKAGNFTAPNLIDISSTAQSKSGVLSVGGLTLPAGGIIDSGGSTGDYGAATIRGTKNGWGGANFRDSSNNNLGTLMMHSSYSGFYNASQNNWRWYATEGGNTYQPGYVQASDVYAGRMFASNYVQAGYVYASDVYAGGRWMSSIVSDTGPDSGTLCGWQATKENTLVLCKGYRPMYDGCPSGYTLNVIDAATWPQYFCSKN